MELEVWKGDWGLASIDLQSLRTYAYIKFLGAPAKLIERRNPFYTPTGSFPVFRHGKHVLTNFTNIIDYLKSQNFDADIHLTREELFSSWACDKYLENNLLPCLQYIWWGDNINSGQDLKMWYMKNITFPFNYYYTGGYENKAQEVIDIVFGSETDSKDIYLNVYKIADQCFNDLSAKLSDKEFFFGSRPSSLDATVFAYLALILKIPQKNATLVNKLKTHDKLLQFVVRISQRYFIAIHQVFVVGVTRTPTLKVEKKDIHKGTKEKIYAGLFAIIAMTCFAFSKGIFQLNFREDYEGDDFNDYYDLEDEDDDT